MHKIYFCLSIFYTLEDSAWSYSIQILTIGDFNSFVAFGTPCRREWLGKSLEIQYNSLSMFLFSFMQEWGHDSSRAYCI